MSKSSIEWTQETWNPVTGCTRVSEGCDHCYAVTMTRRLEAMGQEKYRGLVNPGKKHFNGQVKTHEEVLTLPLGIKKPTTFFVNSMSDLFHEAVPFEFVDKVFAVMALTPRHTYQVLTKRPDRMAEYFQRGKAKNTVMNKFWVDAAELELKVEKFKCLWLWIICPEILPNVWMGTSIENQKAADERIPELLKVPAAVRFLSCEPLLGAINLRKWLMIQTDLDGNTRGFGYLHWVIAGGESGHGARPMHPDWVRSLRDQCVAAGVPFFFKQWGEWMPGSEATCKTAEGKKRVLFHEMAFYKVGKKAAGNSLDEEVWEQFPEGRNEG